MSKDLGKTIRRLMDGLSLSQKQLAELAGVTEVSMSRYISGERDPAIDTLANIATALHTTMDFLVRKERETDFVFREIKARLARNAARLSNRQKREIIDVLLAD